MTAVRWILALFSVWLGGLGFLGSALAFRFERDAFGIGTDAARPGYLAMYAALAVGCAVAPVAAWWWLLPSRRGWAIPAAVVSVTVSLVILGALSL
jgi:hypothetical protein